MNLAVHKSLRELGVIRVIGYSLPKPEKGFICNLELNDGRIVTVLIRSGKFEVVD